MGSTDGTLMLLHVLLDGSPWLADVGFGSGLLEPIALEAGATVDQDGWGYRLERAGDAWLLTARQAGVWSDLYGFTLEPQQPVDYVVANHYTASHPRSPFVGQVVAMRNGVGVRRRLRDRELAVEGPDDLGEQRTLSADERGEALGDVFGIALDAEDLAALRSR